jgi:LmbE family N-acetylglucosaminyl deacetylase
MQIDTAKIFQGVIVITVPHMDDEVLACGGLIAQMTNKHQIHIIYATDGMRSPDPVIPWRDTVSLDLGNVRMNEAGAATGFLGIPRQNIHFLGLPESQLKNYKKDLYDALLELITNINPVHIFTPFRYDRHTDHLALNHVVTSIFHERMPQAEVIEYFVYYKWRLLPKGDVRKYILPQFLLEVNIDNVSSKKRKTLDFFKTQTTIFYDWQTRPNLTAQLLDEVSQQPELFLRYYASFPGSKVFAKNVFWIRLAHRLEPFIKKKKDKAVALWHSIFKRKNGKAV